MPIARTKEIEAISFLHMVILLQIRLLLTVLVPFGQNLTESYP
jgi:hypothetical protein